MKILILIILLTRTQTEKMFLDKVLSNFSDSSYYLSINLNLSDFKGKVIIENSDFFYYLNQNKGIDMENYSSFAKKILQGKEPLIIQSSDFERWEFTKVCSIASITENAKKGIEEFIRIYFNGKVLKHGICDDERTAIISQLFKWEVASYIDDETGYLVISR
jgi:hypothetical protein